MVSGELNFHKNGEIYFGFFPEGGVFSRPICLISKLFRGWNEAG
jgi:hypothetical protein